MKNIEKLLSNLPKHKLALRADLKLRLKLHYILWKRKYMCLFVPSWQRAGAFMMLLVFISTSSLSAYAYTSDQVVPGKLLYPVKQSLEMAEITLTKNPQTQNQKHIKFADKRLREAKIIISDTNNPTKPEILTKTMDNLRGELVSANKIVAPSKYINSLSNLAQNIPIDDRHYHAIESVALTADYLKKQLPENKFKEKLEIEPKVVVTTPTIATASIVTKKPTTEATSSHKTPEKLQQNTSREKEHKPEKKLTKQEVDKKITKVKEKVKDIIKVADQKKSEEHNKAKQLVIIVNNEVKQAQVSVNNNELKQAETITHNTEVVINNAEIFIKKPESDESAQKEGERSRDSENNETREQYQQRQESNNENTDTKDSENSENETEEKRRD